MEQKYEYKVHGATVCTTRKATPVSEWLAEAKGLFGPDVKKWRFTCPMCGITYSIEEFTLAGGKDPNYAYQECIGRYRHAGPPDDKNGNPCGCNWCAYGLLGTAGKGRVIEAEDGSHIEVFHFAASTPTECAARILDAEFSSIWDGGICITTRCKVNESTKEVFDIEVSEDTADLVNELNEEFVTIAGAKYPVVSKEYMESDQEESGGYWYE